MKLIWNDHVYLSKNKSLSEMLLHAMMLIEVFSNAHILVTRKNLNMNMAALESSDHALFICSAKRSISFIEANKKFGTTKFLGKMGAPSS